GAVAFENAEGTPREWLPCVMALSFSNSAVTYRVDLVLLRDSVRAQPEWPRAGRAGHQEQVPGARAVVLVRADSGSVRRFGADPRTLGAGPDRSVRVRQVDVPALPEPHERPDRGHTACGRRAAGRDGHLSPRHGSRRVAPPRRHGLPEIQSLSKIDLREHRLRAARGRNAQQGPASGNYRALLATSRAVGRGEGSA